MCSTFLGNIKEAFVKNPDLTNLLFDDFFRNAIHNAQVCQINIAATVSITTVTCSALPTIRPMAHYRVHTVFPVCSNSINNNSDL